MTQNHATSTNAAQTASSHEIAAPIVDRRTPGGLRVRAGVRAGVSMDPLPRSRGWC
ncbi:MAG: hypothetical protein IT379_09045 [Deltaproteobacteria bacterium]|nr:hypothetical protein [Deltaproteobacteria bacterium]